MSLRMLTNLSLAEFRLTTAQQRSTGQNLQSDMDWCPLLFLLPLQHCALGQVCQPYAQAALYSPEEDHPLSVVRGCLINIFAATLQSWRPFPEALDYMRHFQMRPQRLHANINTVQ
jgi:hypothetical protein